MYVSLLSDSGNPVPPSRTYSPSAFVSAVQSVHWRLEFSSAVVLRVVIAFHPLFLLIALFNPSLEH
jgi:hypothetical protein